MPPKLGLSGLQFRTVRLATFTEGASIGSAKSRKKWSHPTLTSDHMADSGFYYTPTKLHPDQVTCHWCQEKEYGLGEINSICEFHHKNHPECSYSKITMFLEGFVKSSNKGTYWQKLKKSAGKEITDPICTDSYLLRLSTFKNWWKFDNSIETKVTSHGLAEAGFYYSPVETDDDRVICMYCDCPLSDWALEDDPVAEHSKNSFEYCYFLELHRASKKTKKSRVDPPKTSNATRSASTSPKIAEDSSQLKVVPKNTKPAEKDAFDFSIEELDNFENNTIFKGKDMLPKRFTRKRKKEIPSFVVSEPNPKRQTNKNNELDNKKPLPAESRRRLESLKRTVQEEIDRALQELGSDSYEHNENNKEETYDEKKYNQDGMSSRADEAREEIEVSKDSEEGDGNDDSGEHSVSVYELESDTAGGNDSDASFSVPDTSSSLPEKRKGTTKQPNTPASKKRNTLVARSHVSQFDDGDDFGIDEAELQKILNSPKKARKVKVLQKTEPVSLSGSFYDNSNQNLGDYDESNLSFLEKNIKPAQLVQSKAEKLIVSDKSKEDFAPEPKPKPEAEHKLAISDQKNESLSFSKEDKRPEAEFTEPKGRVLPSEMSILEVLAPYSDVKTELIPSSFGPESAEFIDKSIIDSETSLVNTTLLKTSPSKEADLDLTSSDSEKFHTTEMNLDDASQSTMTLQKSLHDAEKSETDAGTNTSNQQNSSNNEEATSKVHIEDALEKDEQENDKPTEGEVDFEEEAEKELATEKLHAKPSLKDEKSANVRSNNSIDKTISDEAPKAHKLTSEHNLHEHMTTDSIVLETSPVKASNDPLSKLRVVGLLPSRLDQGPVLEPLETTKAFSITKSPSKSPNEDNEQAFTVSPSSYRVYQKDLEELEIEFVDDVILDDTTRTKAEEMSVEPQSDPTQKEPSMEIRDDSYVVNDSASEPGPIEVSKSELVPGNAPSVSFRTEGIARHNEKSITRQSVENLAVEKSEKSLSVAFIHNSSSKIQELDENTLHGQKLGVPVTGRSPNKNGSPQFANDSTPLTSSTAAQPKKKAPSPPSITTQPKEKSPSPPSRITTKTLADESDLHHKTETSFSRLSFDNVEASTPQKIVVASVAPIVSNATVNATTDELKIFPHVSLEFAYSQIKALEEAIERMSELSSTKFDLHNDADGYLTEFIAAMPEKEESMTIQDWILENAASCERTVATICSQIISSYLEDFEKFISHVESMATIE